MAAVHDVMVGEKHVPKGTTGMVNMWAITHDEKVYNEAKEFKTPFGAGRRVCPGKAMDLAFVHLWLAQLLHNFKWVPFDDSPVDLDECLMLSVEMKKPLLCKVVART
ncbi:cytochrome P450 family protein [Medicago truncatula]|uniref:Cytochrome P450 family protein n=1 Tax=Medicago truncatula TaxID=3880 RepID=G7J3K9_MEDTR|nr:cytochrome P450 family protein [Medicago truncatula]